MILSRVDCKEPMITTKCGNEGDGSGGDNRDYHGNNDDCDDSCGGCITDDENDDNGCDVDVGVLLMMMLWC